MEGEPGGRGRRSWKRWSTEEEDALLFLVEKDKSQSRPNWLRIYEGMQGHSGTQRSIKQVCAPTFFGACSGTPLTFRLLSKRRTNIWCAAPFK